MPAQSTELLRARLGRRELLALGLTIALVPLNSTMLAVAIPKIAFDIHVDATNATQWLVTGYLLVGIALQSPGGKLSDAIGYGRALTLGRVIFTAGSFLGFFGHGLPVLVLSRGLMAAGGAVLVPSAMATVRLRLPPEKRTAAFGAFSAVMGLAAALGPLVGGELAGHFGWRTLFAVNAPILVVSALLGRTQATAPTVAAAAVTRRAPLQVDVVGSLLLALGLALLVLSTRLPNGAWFALGGAALLALFVPWELRAREPVVDLRLFKRPVYSASLLVIGLQNLAMYALVFLLPLVLSLLFGVEARASGRTLATFTFAMVAGSIVGSRAASVTGARVASALGAATATIGMVLCATLPLLSTSSFVLPLVVCGFGLGVASPPAQSAGLDAVPSAQSGMAAGVSSTVRYLGGVIGVAIATSVLATGDPTERFRMVSWIFAGALAMAFAAAFALPSKRAGTRTGARRP